MAEDNGGMDVALSRGRRTRALLLSVVIASAACLDDTARYGPAQDDAAMAVIASAWADGAGFSLSLCEDTESSAAWRGPDCAVEHVVRGGGLGRAHTEEHSRVGCGGCRFRNVAYVRGTLQGGGLAGPVAVDGIVELGSRGEDPYDLPYSVSLSCIAGTCTFEGSIQPGGELRGEVRTETAGAAVSAPRVATATCP